MQQLDFGLFCCNITKGINFLAHEHNKVQLI